MAHRSLCRSLSRIANPAVFALDCLGNLCLRQVFHHMIDHAAARRNMVSGQIRTNRVTDERLIGAMEEIPRERFVPHAKRGVAYVDEDVEIAAGRYLMEPMVLARLVQEADIGPGDVVLDVGCGTGYATAVMARLAGTVVALDVDGSLAAEAEQALSGVGADNAIVVTGPLAEGYARQAPYDVILLGGAVDHLPQALADQLAEAGRIVGVVREPGTVGQATLWARHRGALSSRSLFEASLPSLPGIARPVRFEF